MFKLVLEKAEETEISSVVSECLLEIYKQIKKLVNNK